MADDTQRPLLTEREALEAINELRSNIIATQYASWSNVAYPLVAILNAAGFELEKEPGVDKVAQHFDCYGGAGGYPGHLNGEPSTEARSQARRVIDKRERQKKHEAERVGLDENDAKTS